MKKKSNVEIIIDTLRRNGPQTRDELAAALLVARKPASRKIVGITIRNARAFRGAEIIYVGAGRYVLADVPPEGVRCIKGKWQIRGATRWKETTAATAEEAKQRRDRIMKGGCL